MRRGSEELIRLMDSFESACKAGICGYVGSMERMHQHGKKIEGASNVDFYVNGETNSKFRSFMAGYVTGRNA